MTPVDQNPLERAFDQVAKPLFAISQGTIGVHQLLRALADLVLQGFTVSDEVEMKGAVNMGQQFLHIADFFDIGKGASIDGGHGRIERRVAGVDDHFELR